jgi:hypothetical protein
MMNRFLPLVFSFLVSGTVAAAVISILVCGAVDGFARLMSLRTTPQPQPSPQPSRQREAA